LKIPDAHILKDQMINAKDNLVFNMQLILLLDKDYEPDEEKRIDKAFRHFGKDEKDFELFESYVLGGIEVLYQKLIENAGKSDDFIDKLTSFTDEINSRYYSEIDKDVLLNSLN